MNPELQSILALIVVALAAGWLAWRSWGRRRTSGCGSDHCSAVSRDVKRLQAKLKSR